ncbi:histidine kinase [uncultured Olleya sp.]|uniref:sensor histidine kinase n=1 Tax=uncultured Olleya sp. TaxID=757243 RepID=UPI0025957CB5|nr:histidine kinase [uncultured Olleya sp.]
MSKKAIYYWSIQIIVWTLLSVLVAFTYWFGGNKLKLQLWQLILDFSVIMILTVLTSHFLKQALNRFVKFDNLKLIDGFNVIWLLFVFTILFFVTYLLYNYLIYNYVYDRSDVLLHESQNLKNNVIVFVNYGLYFVVWTVFYVAIKGLMQLNKSREVRLSLEANLKESQLNTLKGQVNPHFMFNSLNNIRGLMLEDVGKARTMLTNLSETLRYSLTKSEVNAIALEDELEMVENYVAISKIQFEDRLQFITEVDSETLSCKIPPMIIQMLVENALKHGISNLKKGGQVYLITKIEEDQLNIIVSNSGVLKVTQNSTQLGLKNIKQRLKLLYGPSAIFNLDALENQVVATIKIPIL